VNRTVSFKNEPYCLGLFIYCASRSMYSLGLSGLCPAEVGSFISIHQEEHATALLLLHAWFIVVHQVSLS